MLWGQDTNMSQYSSLKNKLVNGDSIDELKKLKDNSVDLLCTDPPYGYGFMGKSWDKMLPPKEIFQESLRVLKPGSFAFVMSAPRSDVQYRMAQMLEDVGFEIGYTPIYWTYATGFPKAMNISKMIDKQKKGERNGKSDEFATYIKSRREKLNLTKGYVDKEICDGSSMYSFYEGRNNENGDWAVYLPNKERYEKLKKLLQMDDRFDDFIDNTVKVVNTKDGDFGYQKDGDRWDNKYKITEPNSDKAKELHGSYGGFQPKPAIEVVIVAMKPLGQKGYLDQALDNQKGITWLDDCRIPFENMGKESKTANRKSRQEGQVFKSSGFGVDGNATASPLGRFAANLLVSDDVLNDGTTTKSVKRSPKNNKDNPDQMLYTPKKAIYSDENTYDDEGGFSRYYSLDAWWNSRLNKLPKEVQITFPFLRVAKAGKKEKNDGLDNFEVKQKDTRTDTGKGSFTEKGLQPGKNIHPTVKPLTLMSYLVTLGSRKGDVVLDPFMGSGTTPMACVTLDRIYIGIEREDEYFEIAEARVNKVEQPMKQWDKWL